MNARRFPPPASIKHYWAASVVKGAQMRPRFLNKDEFAQAVRNTPLVSIDLIIRDPDQCTYLSGSELTSLPKASGSCQAAWSESTNDWRMRVR
jgi:hypothetical protein